MGIRFHRSCWAVLLIAFAWLLCRPGSALAHPQLCGPWVAKIPRGGYMAFFFGPGECLWGGVWRGPFYMVVSGVPATFGTYELQMFTGTEGTLALRSGPASPGWTVGTLDLSVPEVVYLHTTFKR